MPIRLRRALIPDFQSSAVGEPGEPHILSGQSFARLPRFVEHRNGAAGLDLSKERNVSGGDGPRIRPVHPLGRGQARLGFAAWRLRGSHMAQPGGCIIRPIPVHQCWADSTHRLERRKSSSLPKGMCPQAVQLFDFAMAFGFGDWPKDEFDAQVQTQANKLSKEAWRFVAAAKHGSVVELQKSRDSQGFPGVAALPNHGGAVLVGRDSWWARPRAQVQGMKRIDLGACFEIATGPIHGGPCSLDRRQWFRKVSGRRLGQGGDQVVRSQDPVEGGQRGSVLAQDFAQFATDRTSPAPAPFLMVQTRRRLDHQSHDPRRVSAWRVRRTPRVTAETGSALLLESFSPFA